MRVLSLLSILILPTVGQAHPGHGTSNGHDAIHYLASSGHAGPAILILTAICIYFILREPKTQSQRVKH